MNQDIQPEWRTEHEICSYDVDPYRTTRLPTLCRFMQEAAYHHAGHLGLGHSFLSERGMAWVLSRQRVVVDHLPKWGDAVTVRTWPSGRDRLFFYRDFEMISGDGSRVLRASNAWTLIDIKKRERANPDIYLNVDIPEGVRVFGSKLGRLKECACPNEKSFPVTYGDLDLNGHVNNVRYIEWMLNSLPFGFHERHTLREMEINFLAEAMCGQSLLVCSGEVGPLQFGHSIKSNGMELCRSRSAWSEKGV